MEVVRQGIDDRYIRMFGKQLQPRVLEGADCHEVHHAGKDFRSVFQRFTAPELGVGVGKKQAGAAQLRHGHFEGHARARGRLVKDHRQRLVFQRIFVKGRAVLQGDCALNDRVKLCLLEIHQCQKMSGSHFVGFLCCRRRALCKFVSLTRFSGISPVCDLQCAERSRNMLCDAGTDEPSGLARKILEIHSQTLGLLLCLTCFVSYTRL